MKNEKTVESAHAYACICTTILKNTINLACKGLFVMHKYRIWKDGNDVRNHFCLSVYLRNNKFK